MSTRSIELLPPEDRLGTWPRIGGSRVQIIPIEERKGYLENSGSILLDSGVEPTHVIAVGGRNVGAIDDDRKAHITKPNVRIGETLYDVARELLPWCHNGLVVYS